MRLFLAITLALCASQTLGCKDKKSELQPVDPAMPDEEPEAPQEPGDQPSPHVGTPAAEPDEPIVERDAGPPAIVVPEVVE
jgi:hypothetical protein